MSSRVAALIHVKTPWASFFDMAAKAAANGEPGWPSALRREHEA